MDEEVAVSHEIIKNVQGNPINDYIAGAIGGMAGILVGHPFDTTKVQLQTQPKHKQYRGTFHAVSHIKTQGLVKGFFRGLSWPLWTYGVVNSIFFGVYGNTLKVLQRMRNEGNKISYLDIYISGCVAGAAQLVVACPVDRFKVILQSQIPRDQMSKLEPTGTGKGLYYKGPWEAAVATVKQHGMTSCYRGLVAMAYRDVPSFGLYCFVYEYLSDQMHRHRLTDDQGIIASFVAGGVTGTVTWFSIMPFDVIKSRLQADLTGQYRNMWDCGQKTVQSEGFRALYKGTIVTCLRAFPVNAATFLVYSQILKNLS